MVSPGPQPSSTQARSLIEDARILRQVPLFAALPDELFDRVAAEARQVRVPAGVVLSGGGARAFAHLGVMEELIGSGLVVDRVAGVSMGAVVAAGIALGGDPAELSETFAKGFAAGSPTRDYTLPLYSLTRGRRADRLLAGLLGEARIEELGMRYFALSCDLIARERMIHRTGPLATAVRASLAIPGVFPPVRTPDGRLLVDGGVLDNLPVETMAAEAEGPVIAVDVTGQIEAGPRVVRPRLERLAAPLRSLLTGSEARLPRVTETMMRTVTVGSIDTVAEGRKHADLVIQPEVDGCGTLDWGRLAESREAGRHAAREALDSGTVAELPFARDGR